MRDGHLLIVMDDNARRSLRITGFALLVIGAAGIVLPQALGLALSLLIATLLILAGLFSAYVAWSGYRRSNVGWMKPAMLIVLGLLLAFYPKLGTAAIGLLLIIYFFVDGFSSLFLGLDLRPLPGWGWSVFNGAVSLLLAVIFIAGWPFSSHWLVGLLVGMSLVFDGVALLALTSRPKSP